ncbi:MAG TPA: type II secretion system protein, partial [bacterium]|nr:type II secretion system protein [bacterium]
MIDSCSMKTFFKTRLQLPNRFSNSSPTAPRNGSQAPMKKKINMFPLSRISGFTLIESLIVISILAVILVMLSTSIFTTSPKHFLDKAAYEIY